jgi:hypothetical protein
MTRRGAKFACERRLRPRLLANAGEAGGAMPIRAAARKWSFPGKIPDGNGHALASAPG